ncbi:hypothetical protein TELCIR_22528 [Teladorsagia circumcincta]|uniref:Reverse transcriptase domain-containing protein n=1 Tax=Teladorsagia circumcincta TaxID=45464 RepID=A0A2G9TDM8_TELCI|nr:hypothetical protein TELCIR_22528 [Teladorsagia circumcincta]
MPEDIFASLNGGTIFSRIDLSDAYLPFELSEESKRQVVINTHRGVFQYNRLPFGIKTAPGIFQQVMNKMVSGLKGVTTSLDDILVSGITKEEHNENLLTVWKNSRLWIHSASRQMRVLQAGNPLSWLHSGQKRKDT